MVDGEQITLLLWPRGRPLLFTQHKVCGAPEKL